MTDMDSKLARTSTNIEQLNEKQENLAAAYNVTEGIRSSNELPTDSQGHQGDDRSMSRLLNTTTTEISCPNSRREERHEPHFQRIGEQVRLVHSDGIHRHQLDELRNHNALKYFECLDYPIVLHLDQDTHTNHYTWAST